jgi:hypothetical protein
VLPKLNPPAVEAFDAAVADGADALPKLNPPEVGAEVLLEDVPVDGAAAVLPKLNPVDDVVVASEEGLVPPKLNPDDVETGAAAVEVLLLPKLKPPPVDDGAFVVVDVEEEEFPKENPPDVAAAVEDEVLLDPNVNPPAVEDDDGAGVAPNNDPKGVVILIDLTVE